jgi:hypothetical protein
MLSRDTHYISPNLCGHHFKPIPQVRSLSFHIISLHYIARRLVRGQEGKNCIPALADVCAYLEQPAKVRKAGVKADPHRGTPELSRGLP